MFNFNLFKKSNNSYKVTAIIMAAGSGTRMNIQSSKQLVNLIDKPFDCIFATFISIFRAG